MTPRRKQGRRETILGWLFSDPWRKLGAIGLALLSWEYLDRSVNEIFDSTLEIRLPGQTVTPANYLRIDIDARDYTLTPGDVLDATASEPTPKTDIAIQMKGEKATINRMRGALEFVFRPSRAELEVAKRQGWLEFTKDRLQHENADLGRDLQSLDAVTIKPARIRLMIRPNASRNQPLAEEHVRLDYGDSGLQQRLSNPEFSSVSVDLRGPEEAINRLLPAGKIFLGKVSEVSPDATTVRIELELLPDFKDIVIDKTIYVTYQVEPDWLLADFRNVRVEVDHRLLPDDKRGFFKAVPARLPIVKIKVKGDLATRVKTMSDSQKQEFVRDHLRLVVYPLPRDLDEPLARKPAIEFVRLDDIPTPQLRVDYQVVDVETVRIAPRNAPKPPDKNNGK
ncbi:MAG: hypothetical protein ACYTKC_11840 [Planctomycetota bacterium]|jgi:hypothetical protein